MRHLSRLPASMHLPRLTGCWAPSPHRPLHCRWAALSRNPAPGRSWPPLALPPRRTTCSRWTISQHLAASRSSCRRRSSWLRVTGEQASTLRRSLPNSPCTQLTPTCSLSPIPRPHSPCSARSPWSLSDLFPTGTPLRTSSSFQYEMSQKGFSSVLTTVGGA